MEHVGRRRMERGGGGSDRREAIDPGRVLVQLHAQPIQAAADVLLRGLPDPALAGQVRVSVCDLPGIDALPADRHRLARWRGARGAPEANARGGHGIHADRVRYELLRRRSRLLGAQGIYQVADGGQGHGRGLLRLRLRGYVRHLPGGARRRRHQLQRLHAGDARGHGDPGLPRGPLPRLAAATGGDGRPGQHAVRTGLRSEGESAREPPRRAWATGSKLPRAEIEEEMALEKMVRRRGSERAEARRGAGISLGTASRGLLEPRGSCSCSAGSSSASSVGSRARR